ncbi:hypothetical protein F9L33_10310 [Amylibacter sp. SFDW26]|uniref:hypothetical protein n=1 Tax=Amylibacter sp. SFDW26 TaxID=2652722 RepID=UPI001262872E|nr:hypothetical protein [Amylibacter sp. SFDW26]KAB7613755.1 hypothetical protein F9L33_10310 [Amylibacter sp. SFDW26]
MMQSQSLISLDDLELAKIREILSVSSDILRGKIDVSKSAIGKIITPIFLQESSRTYTNSVSAFLRMGGQVLPITINNTRFGSKWAEPIQDFSTLVDTCADCAVVRASDVNTVLNFNRTSTIPIINAGNGFGLGSEHPMQALIDLFTIQNKFNDQKLNILMMGGQHIRSARTQVKLFHRLGHTITVMSPEVSCDNSDVDEFIAINCKTISSLDDVDLGNIDIIYHNGLDEDPNVHVLNKYILTKDLLEKKHFTGVVMHSLPRKQELPSCVDNTSYNLYFEQMRISKFVFQSVYKMQLDGTLYE